MTALWMVSRYVDGQKRELLQYLVDNDAVDAARAIHLADVAVKPSILRSLVDRKVVVRTAAGRYYVDPSRVPDAFGASNRFILYAMGAFMLVFLVIMLW